MKTQITPSAKPAHLLEFLNYLEERTKAELKQADILENRLGHIHNSSPLNVLLYGKYSPSIMKEYRRGLLVSKLADCAVYKNMVAYYIDIGYDTVPVPASVSAGFYEYFSEKIAYMAGKLSTA